MLRTSVVTHDVLGSEIPRPADDSAKTRSSPAWALLWILLATVWSYSPCLSGGFIWDDNSYIRDNVLLRSTDGLWRIWFDPEATPQYHPLVFTSFWIEHAFWGLRTTGYHVVNLLLHCATTLVFWVGLRRLGVGGAAFAAGLFALHPAHVESVAWISERKDVLSAFFFGCAILMWLRHLRTERWIDSVGTTAAVALTFLSKSVLCTLPVTLALLAAWKRPRRWKRWALHLIPSFALSTGVGLLTIWREHAHGNPILPYGFSERGLIAARALWTYVQTLLWPVDLTIAYVHWPVSANDPLVWAGLALLTMVPILLLGTSSRAGAGPFVGFCFFLVTLLPMLGFVDFNIMQFAFVSDHFLYVASAGLLSLAAAGAEHTTRHLPAEQRTALALLPLGILAWMTSGQARLYADAETIWRDNVAKQPGSWTGHVNLAGVLARAGKPQEAVTELQEALRIKPDAVVAHTHLGILSAALQHPEEAVAHFEAALRFDPSRADAANNLGTVLMTLGRTSEAEAHLGQAIANHPNYPEAWHHWGIAAARLGRKEDAIRRIEEALRLKPDFPAARADLERLRPKDNPTGASPEPTR